MTTFSYVGYIDGEAIASLRSIFKSTLSEKGLTPGCGAAQDLAATMVRLYMAGVTEVDELLLRLQAVQTA